MSHGHGHHRHVLAEHGEGLADVLTHPGPELAFADPGLGRGWLDQYHPGRTATVLTVPDLIRMVEHIPAVVHRHGGPLFLGYTVEEWGHHLHVEEYPFVSDQARDDVTTGLRAFALGIEPYASRHILGDTGVGKSRAVFEALNVVGLREITAVVSDVSMLDDRSVRAAMTQPYAWMVLVVDDVTGAQLESLRTLAAATAGRLRLITIGDPGAPRTLGADRMLCFPASCWQARPK